MAKGLSDSLMRFVEWMTYSNPDTELRRWAQVEYGKQWELAYNFIKYNPGKVPVVGKHI